MKAMILAAGKGTRLKQLTSNKPKALVELNGTPIIGLLLQKLKSQGFNRILINIHHFGNMIIEYIQKNHNFGLDITFSDESKQLLGTGGAILKAAPFFSDNETVLIHNVDIFSNINFNILMKRYTQPDIIAKLIVNQRKTKRYLLFDENLNLTGWTNKTTNEYRWVSKPVNNFKELAFSGIWIAKPEFVNMISLKGSFSIIDTWLEIANKKRIVAIVDKSSQWFDLGTPERIKQAETN